jgi:hypothetical protein
MSEKNKKIKKQYISHPYLDKNLRIIDSFIPISPEYLYRLVSVSSDDFIVEDIYLNNESSNDIKSADFVDMLDKLFSNFNANNKLNGILMERSGGCTRLTSSDNRSIIGIEKNINGPMIKDEFIIPKGAISNMISVIGGSLLFSMKKNKDALIVCSGNKKITIKTIPANLLICPSCNDGAVYKIKVVQSESRGGMRYNVISCNSCKDPVWAV